MKINKLNSFNSLINKIKQKTSSILFISIISTGLIILFLSIFSYNQMFSTFKSTFSSGKFLEANKILLTNQKINPIKHIFLNSSLEKYFIDYMDKLYSKYQNNELSDLQVVSTLSEMERYPTSMKKIEEFKTSLDILKDSETSYNLAIKKFKDKDYVGAFNTFNKVLPFDPNYMSSVNYKQDISQILKEKALKNAEELVSQRYYSKAITLLEENMVYYGNDKDVLVKIDEYKNKKEKVLNEKSSSKTKSNLKEQNTKIDDKVAETSALTTSITSANVNSLDLKSDSPYLVHVNLKNQYTYVYKGSKNNWNLEKKFLCSTGTEGKETPTGIYTTKSKGDWFYEPKYKQGGKYWVTFMDAYMFHSLPFAKDKKTVVDETLGTPASHGCIRLSIEDAKWIYDNVPIGSKLIIN